MNHLLTIALILLKFMGVQTCWIFCSAKQKQAKREQNRLEACSKFDDWYKNNEDMSWLSEIPECPSKLNLDPDNNPCNPKIWTAPVRSDDYGLFALNSRSMRKYHPGANWCFRSVVEY